MSKIAPEAERNEGVSFPQNFRESMARPTLVFGHLRSRNVSEWISIVISHPVCGTLLREH